MKKNQAIGYIRSCVGNDRKVTVAYKFTEDNLPAVIRLHGIDGYIDVARDVYKEKLLPIEGDEVLTIGRLPLCDIQADHFEDNLISRVHVIWQKIGDQYLLINCGIYGTTAMERTPDGGLRQLTPSYETWEDFAKD